MASQDQQIVVLPDGEMMLATKVRPPEKEHLICWKCRTHLLYDKDAEKVKCGACGALNGTTVTSPEQRFIIYRCGGCNNVLRAPRNSLAVCCAICRSISLISR
mmetsp:Transcript_21057/g.38962  ORF Transcript_21057/g.38962 Transcript_21057/m.38962 type:complete len:103 (-) Transcript_21057:11-319(-)